MDRRNFLSTSLFAVTALSGQSPQAASQKPLPAPASTAKLSEARFRSLLGSQFHFSGAQWRGRLELSEVVGRASDARTEQFTTIFKAGGGNPQAGVYQVTHPAIGRFALRIEGRQESDVRHAAFSLLRA